MEERLNEILERLGALEQRLDRLERDDRDGGGARTDRAGGGPGCPFREEERRIVDLIVGLTAQHVEEAIDARMEGAPPPRGGYGRHRHRDHGHHDHGHHDHGHHRHHDHGPRHPHHDHGGHGHGPPPGYGPPTGGPPGSWGGPPAGPPPPPEYRGGRRGWPHGDR